MVTYKCNGILGECWPTCIWPACENSRTVFHLYEYDHHVKVYHWWLLIGKHYWGTGQ